MIGRLYRFVDHTVTSRSPGLSCCQNADSCRVFVFFLVQQARQLGRMSMVNSVMKPVISSWGDIV